MAPLLNPVSKSSGTAVGVVVGAQSVVCGAWLDRVLRVFVQRYGLKTSKRVNLDLTPV